MTERTGSDIAPLQSWSCESFSGEKVLLVDTQPAPEITGKGLSFTMNCKDIFSQTTGFQHLHGSIPAATVTHYSLGRGKCGERKTYSRSSQE